MMNGRAGNDEAVGARSHRSTLGWIGVLTGPTAWTIQLLSGWTLGEVIACAPANGSPGEVLGLPVSAVTGIVNAVLLVVTVLVGVGSFAELRGIRAGTDRTPGHRATWLATAGVMTSVLFATLIASSFVPIALIGECT